MVRTGEKLRRSEKSRSDARQDKRGAKGTSEAILERTDNRQTSHAINLPSPWLFLRAS